MHISRFFAAVIAFNLFTLGCHSSEPTVDSSPQDTEPRVIIQEVVVLVPVPVPIHAQPSRSPWEDPTNSSFGELIFVQDPLEGFGGKKKRPNDKGSGDGSSGDVSQNPVGEYIDMLISDGCGGPEFVVDTWAVDTNDPTQLTFEFAGKQGTDQYSGKCTGDVSQLQGGCTIHKGSTKDFEVQCAMTSLNPVTGVVTIHCDVPILEGKQVQSAVDVTLNPNTGGMTVKYSSGGTKI